MRLLIYLLALISGFPAADAARAQVTPASSVAQSAVAAAEALASREQQTDARPANFWPSDSLVFALDVAPLTLNAPTPITRHDVALQ
jgi:hypothetical protein